MAVSVAALRAKGVRVLNDPIANTSGQTAGETWVYFLTPWGSQLELVSYPHGKAYEQADPPVRLWSPRDAAADGPPAATDEAAMRALADAHLRAWGERDAAARRRSLGQVYAADVVVVDPQATARGLDALNELIGHVQAQTPGFTFRLARPVDSHHGAIRLSWEYGPPGKPPAVTGQDVMLVRDGRIASLYVFLDPSKP